MPDCEGPSLILRTASSRHTVVFIASTGLALCEPIKTDAPAYQSKGTTMVPMRAIFEWLGAEVSFDSATGLITAKRGEQVVSLKPGDRTATVNGESKTMSAPAETRQGRTFVPLRFVAEAFGADVGWDASTGTVTVKDGVNSGTLLVAPVSRAPSVKSGAKAGDVRINPKDGAEMVWVPAGDFLMGSKEDEGATHERPQRKVYLDGYWIYKYPVTVAQYRRFCLATDRSMPHPPGWGWKDVHPMVMVNWQDAADYAKWAGASLPTEAQWEKAARGTDGRTYPWGDTWDSSKCANSVNERLWNTRPVGSYPTGASPYGAMDMAGNVWEWCADWYDPDYYKSAPTRNPTGPKQPLIEVSVSRTELMQANYNLKGGGKMTIYYLLRGAAASDDNVERFRCAYRSCHGQSIGYSGSYYGFRCAVNP
jgi:formylglycine-generating enzyme